MKTLFLISALSLGLFSVRSDISMMGIKIKDSKETLKKITLPVISNKVTGEKQVTKYEAKNGNDFIVTVLNGFIVEMSNEWSGEKKGAKPLITNFTFGVTTLKDIKKYFGTEGYCYSEDDMIMGKNYVLFNYFEIESPNNEILLAITVAPKDGDYKDMEPEDYMKLDALILVDTKYLEMQRYGDKEIFDKNYKKIKL
jgi:hypothetical protein